MFQAMVDHFSRQSVRNDFGRKVPTLSLYVSAAVAVAVAVAIGLQNGNKQNYATTYSSQYLLPTAVTPLLVLSLFLFFLSRHFADMCCD